jgi:hypothetical protein
MLQKVQFQGVGVAGGDGHDVMKMSKAMPLIKAAIGDFGQIASEATEATAEGM